MIITTLLLPLGHIPFILSLGSPDIGCRGFDNPCWLRMRMTRSTSMALTVALEVILAAGVVDVARVGGFLLLQFSFYTHMPIFPELAQWFEFLLRRHQFESGEEERDIVERVRVNSTSFGLNEQFANKVSGGAWFFSTCPKR
jgi:hypothetical protein